MYTKDELRVQRSISSISRKIAVALSRSHPRAILSEKEFEDSCIKNGLIYSPSKFYIDYASK